MALFSWVQNSAPLCAKLNILALAFLTLAPASLSFSAPKRSCKAVLELDPQGCGALYRTINWPLWVNVHIPPNTLVSLVNVRPLNRDLNLQVSPVLLCLHSLVREQGLLDRESCLAPGTSKQVISNTVSSSYNDGHASPKKIGVLIGVCA